MVDEVVPAAELIPHAKAWLATNPDPVKPWDKKGFALPESRGLLNPEAAAMFSAATGGVVSKGGYNLPAQGAILSTVFEGVQLPFENDRKSTRLNYSH